MMRTLLFKISLVSGIPFGLVTGYYVFHDYVLIERVTFGLLSGISFGILAACILISLDGYLTKKAVTHPSSYPRGINQVRTLEIMLPYRESFDLCLRSIQSVNGCLLRSQDESQGRIVAKAGINWKTWGDIITFQIRKTDTDCTTVEVSSRPSARTTLVDFGKNLQNVERITNYIYKNVKD